jgi:3-hydroxyisobutyrate dehydrogenase-like beta-hydroxyacid dehydrogenase
MTQQPATTEVSVIGLGNMGSTLAQAFLAKGHSVTVWNRTPTRAEPLVKAGARVAETAAASVASSPLTIMCVIDYPAAEAVLASDGMSEALRNRTLVPDFTRGIWQSLQPLGIAGKDLSES